MNLEIVQGLTAIIKPGSVAELRVLQARDGNYTANYTGYFNNIEKMAEAAARFNGNAPAVYFTLNECNPALLARAANRMVKAGPKSSSTTDHDIVKIRWFPIDADAVRPAGISSSSDEHREALNRAEAIMDYLSDFDWNQPFFCDSGNGAHLLYPIDLDNTPENVELIKTCLASLSQKFSDDAVCVDQSVFNPSRIWKVYGTMACKGDATEDRPHRKARIISNSSGIVVPIERLQELAASAHKPSVPAKNATVSTPGLVGIEVESFCLKHGLRINRVENWKDGKKFQITPCPFNQAHSEAIIISHPSGAVSFKCLHNGCVGKTWQDLREMLEPAAIRPKPEPRPSQPLKPAAKQERPSTDPTIDPRIDVDADLSEMLSEVQEQAAGRRTTIPLPWVRLSSGCHALRPGTMTILAGPMKTGKSFFTMSIVKWIHDLGHDWAYLPLEDTRRDWAWRMLSIAKGNYNINHAAQETAEERGAAVAMNMEFLSQYLSRVTQNPRIGIKDQFGKTVIPEVGYERVLGWIAKAAKTKRFIVVDPISQIEFNGRDPWKAESSFVRQALGIISDSDASLLLVAHTVKRSGMNATVDLSAEDVQGSAMYTRLAHTTLLLDKHDLKEVEIRHAGGEIETAMSNRVVTIAAARNGSMTGARLAFMQHLDRPYFEEIGFLAPKTRKGKK